MKCPKCGGEIPFYDLKPNCRHCGVNVLYYTQEEGLIRDAKRTELEGAAARMVIARVKAQFIGSKLVIVRLAFSILAVAALLVPFAGVKYNAPLLHQELSLGIIGLIQSFMNGFAMKTPQLLQSSLFAKQTAAAMIPAGFMVVIVVLDLLIAAALLVGFLKLTESARFMKNASLAGAIVSVATQIAVCVVYFTTPQAETARFMIGFGALAALAMFLVLFFLNRKILNKGIEPEFKENDVKRRELLKKVRAGEVDLDSLPLPVFESEEEHEARMKALEEALLAEEEGKEL
ncbi:MAG: hypothetical protein IK108_01595 [Clostridia bacterium]|nr:hypothetical protein [Clostridia bacterium]